MFLRNCTDSASRRRSNTSANAPVEGGRGTASCKCATAMLERTARLAEAGRDAPSLPVGATPNSRGGEAFASIVASMALIRSSIFISFLRCIEDSES